METSDVIAIVALGLSLVTFAYSWGRNRLSDKRLHALEKRGLSRELRRILDSLIQATIELDTLTNDAILTTNTAFAMAGGANSSRRQLYLDQIKKKKSANIQNQQWALELEKSKKLFPEMSDDDLIDLIHDCETREASAHRVIRTTMRTIEDMKNTAETVGELKK